MTHYLNHSAGNPRNSEGSFVKLKDGRILFAYTHYKGESWEDDASADIFAVTSADGGVSWSEPFPVILNTSRNIMSVSLLRLASGRIAMILLQKTLLPGGKYIDCRPLLRFSDDGTASWSEPLDVTGRPPAYLVVCNDRLVQLKSGRIMLPASYHRYMPSGLGRGFGIFLYSDDGGLTWAEAPECCYPFQACTSGFAEPGVVELEEGHLMCWFRTGEGCQFKSFSYDNGMSWTEPIPAKEFRSPGSPLSLKRDPVTGDLYAVWNDYHPARSVNFAPALARGSNYGIWTGGRTPLVVARSADNGKTWIDHTVIENAPDRGFSYTAMFFDGDDLYLGYCCGGGEASPNMLQDLKIRVVKWRKLRGQAK